GSTIQGFLFDPATGTVTNLGAVISPTGINAPGQVSGYGVQNHALIWNAGAITDLHHNPPWTGVASRAWGINDAGVAVGEAQVLISQPEQPALWTGPALSDFTVLVPEFERPQGVAQAINNHGQVTGYYINLDNLDDQWHGFLWQGGRRADVLTMIDP